MEIKDIISSGVLELYALGIASDEEQRQVEKWMVQYPEVAAELYAIERALEDYAMSNAVPPAASVRQSLLSSTQQRSPNTSTQTTTGKVVSMSPVLKWVAAASVVLLIGSTIFNIIFFQKYQKAQQANTEMENQLAARSDENRELADQWQVVQSKYSEPVTLKGLEAAPDAAAKIFWMKNSGEVYIDPSNLPPAPAGKQYQLWGIVDGKPVDGGMIDPLTTGKKIKIQKMKSFGKAEAFAITLEDQGGNPTPKGTMYVMGKI